MLEAAEVLDKVRSQCDDAWERFGLRDYLPDELHGTALIVRDAAPKALAPSREVIGRYMADKGFYLSKEALDGLMLKLEGIGGTP